MQFHDDFDLAGHAERDHYCCLLFVVLVMTIGALLHIAGCAPVPAPNPVGPPAPKVVAFAIVPEDAGVDIKGADVELAGTHRTCCTSGVTEWQVLDDVKTLDLTITADGFDTYHDTFVIEPGIHRVAMERARTARHGVVRGDGRVWVDDDGGFRPFGATLMWAAYGWRTDRGRVEQSLAWLRDREVTDVRILADVGWDTEEIDGAAPDAGAVLGDFLDTAYTQYGIRTLVTAWGGSHRDPIRVAQVVADTVRPRPQTVLYLEAANEAFKNLTDDNALRQMVAILGTAGVPVAGSEPAPGDGQTLLPGASVATWHLDRTPGDGIARVVRQAYDMRGPAVLCDHNEPIGPRSSVYESTDGLQLAMLRATGILMGCGGFVFHNGAGVTGRVDPTHNRPANLWEVPGVEPLMAAVKAVENLLPLNVENWTKTSQHGDGHGLNTSPVGDQPLLADAIWPDNPGWGVNRAYGAVGDGQWAEVLIAVKDHVTLTARFGLDGQATDVESGVSVPLHLNAGETVTLPGNSDAHVGYVLSGVRR